MRAVQLSASLIEMAYSRPGIYVWQNNGKTANQTIGHLHFHVAGVRDDGSTEWGDVPELSLEATDKIAARLKELSGGLLARFPEFSLTSERGDSLDG